MTAPAAVRYAVPLLAGALGSAAVWMLPAGRGDLFSSTLVLLPLAFSAVWSIELWMRDRELASLDRRESAALVGALGALTVAAARAPSLGLAAADPLIVVGLLWSLPTGPRACWNGFGLCWAVTCLHVPPRSFLAFVPGVRQPHPVDDAASATRR